MPRRRRTLADRHAADAAYRQALGAAPSRAVGTALDTGLRVVTRTPSAGPVTITRTDGSQTVEPALVRRELRDIIGVPRAVSVRRRQDIARRDRWLCRYCGTGLGPFHVDHVVPISQGGSNSARNLVLACDTCNTRKGARTWLPKPPGWKPP